MTVRRRENFQFKIGQQNRGSHVLKPLVISFSEGSITNSRRRVSYFIRRIQIIRIRVQIIAR